MQGFFFFLALTDFWIRSPCLEWNSRKPLQSKLLYHRASATGCLAVNWVHRNTAAISWNVVITAESPGFPQGCAWQGFQTCAHPPHLAATWLTAGRNESDKNIWDTFTVTAVLKRFQCSVVLLTRWEDGSRASIHVLSINASPALEVAGVLECFPAVIWTSPLALRKYSFWSLDISRTVSAA